MGATLLLGFGLGKGFFWSWLGGRARSGPSLAVPELFANAAPCRLPVRELSLALSNKPLRLAQDYPMPAGGINPGLISA
jgi:hypothetical protein